MQELLNNSSEPASNLKFTSSQQIVIALAGNPNCGKTSLFNALTGLKYKVANYPGVTVEKKSGALKLENFSNVQLVDLPGIYSLSGTSIDEAIATRLILGKLQAEKMPDLIVCVLDATNLERNLYLAYQLIDLGTPLIIALNMLDLAEERGISIKKEILSRSLEVEVIGVVAKKSIGTEELRSAINKLLLNPRSSSKRFEWLDNSSPYSDSALKIGKLALGKGNYGPRVPAPLVGSGIISKCCTSQARDVLDSAELERKQLETKGVDFHSFEATNRYKLIQQLLSRCCSYRSIGKATLFDRFSELCTHKIWGLIIFAAVMGFIFQAIFMWASYPMDLIDNLFSWLGSKLSFYLPDGLTKSLVVDGVLPGVGSVVMFVPQIAILFFFLGVLEDSGYLSRAAFLMDRLMRKFGLQGRAFIPLLSSFACAIPGIMSTRTIPSFADRLATILIAPLMSCSARLPVYAVLIAAFIPSTYLFGFVSLQGLVLLCMYLLGITAAMLIARILKLSILRGEPTIFVMEMPPFRAPSMSVVLRGVLDRIMIFVSSAGTVILACSIVLWFLATFPHGSVHDTFAGQIGALIEPVIRPLGFGWEIGVGILASFAAREVFISSLATVYNLEDASSSSQSLISLLKHQYASGSFTLATALSLMVFYVFACQCMSTLAVTRRETGSWSWVAFMFSYMTLLAYVASYFTYHLALRFGL